MLNIRVIIARKPKKKRCISMATTTGFVHKKVRGGISHAHIYYQGGNGNSNSFNPNQPTLRDLVYGQTKIYESLQKKLAATDKLMETIHAKMDGFSTAIKNQLSFNKIIETQLAQVATTMSPSMENVTT